MANNSGLIKFCFVTLVISVAGYLVYSEWYYTSYYSKQYTEFLTRLVEKIATSVFHVERTYIIKTVASAKAELGTEQGGRILLLGADAFMMAIVMLAGIVAWPGAILKKLSYMIAAVGVFFIANLARVTALFLIDLHYPLTFPSANQIYSPAFLALVCGLLFYLWTWWSGKHPLDPPAQQ